MNAKVKTFDALTGVRGAAALWVAAFHAYGGLFPELRLPMPLHTLVSSGWIAVDLFFVLSGFIMCHVHLADFSGMKWAPAREFLKLRIARIYPAHLTAALCWLPLLAALALRDGGELPAGVAASYNGRTLAHAVLLTNGWGFPGALGWNLPSWSVGSEWFAYLTFPLIAVGMRRASSVRANVIIAALTVALCVMLAVVVNGGHQYMLPERMTLVRVFSEFLLGACAYGVFAHARVRPNWLAGAAVTASVALAAIPHAALLDALFLPLFAAFVVGLAFENNPVSRLLGSRLMIYLGRISFSLYLMHALVIVAFRQGLSLLGEPRPWLMAVLAIGFLGAAILAGDLLHRFVEEPMRHYLRRKWSARSGQVRPPRGETAEST